MCISDWRIGRLIKSSGKDLGSIPGNPVTVQANKQRVGIGLNIETATSSTSSILLCTFDNGIVIAMTQISSPYLITLEHYGEIVQHQFVLSTTAVVLTANLAEYFLTEEILQSGIDEWNRTYPFNR